MDVSIAQILEARELRAARQAQLLEQYRKPLICFTMNIAGPKKDSPQIREGFRLGQRLLQAQLSGSGIPVLHQETSFEATGPLGFYVADAHPNVLKQYTCQIEDSSPVARLFDMDVLTPDGTKCSRSAPRRCLICQEDARVCGRSRAHSVQQLQEKTQQLLQDALDTQQAQHIASLAVQSLLWEVCTTPKPGLVDCRNSGSHCDMDIFTFTASASALYPYFETCARLGIRSAEAAPAETFQQLRLPGKAAEQAMYAATAGVNTHKGAIFSLGILCAAAGRTGSASADILLSQCAAMTQGVCVRELGVPAQETKGQSLYRKYNLRGVRGQAEDGFPAVKKGLEIFKEGLAQGLHRNDAGCAALLHMLVLAEDTSLFSRSGPDTYHSTLSRIQQLLKSSPYPSREAMEALDAEFTAQNLSPGGSADLLALTYFLYLLEKRSIDTSIF